MTVSYITNNYYLFDYNMVRTNLDINVFSYDFNTIYNIYLRQLGVIRITITISYTCPKTSILGLENLKI